MSWTNRDYSSIPWLNHAHHASNACNFLLHHLQIQNLFIYRYKEERKDVHGGNGHQFSYGWFWYLTVAVVCKLPQSTIIAVVWFWDTFWQREFFWFLQNVFNYILNLMWSYIDAPALVVYSIPHAYFASVAPCLHGEPTVPANAERALHSKEIKSTSF